MLRCFDGLCLGGVAKFAQIAMARENVLRWRVLPSVHIFTQELEELHASHLGYSFRHISAAGTYVGYTAH